MQASKTNLISHDRGGILIRTANQSRENQACIWFVHGSGGMSSNEDLWVHEAIKRGYTTVQVDSYSDRGIFKQKWETMDEYRISPKDRALDLVSAYEALLTKKDVFPFASLNESICVGFSDGGVAGIWLQTEDFPKYWRKSYCLYPGLKTSINPKELYTIDSSRVHILVGAEDNWTPAMYSEEFSSETRCELTVFPGVHHSYSKPGVAQWHENIINHKRERGVYCEYNEDATLKTMEIVFGE